MGRSQVIARAIVRAVASSSEHTSSKVGRRFMSALLAFFKIFDLPLKRICPELFASLRVDHWSTQEVDYQRSFSTSSNTKAEDALDAIGDMGYSGSTFFCTHDQRWLIKSVPRYFEHSFFRDDFMHPYATHMSTHAKSMLVRICDFLASPYYPLGSLFGLAPTHHIIMENILYGQKETESANTAQWETWDLKPMSYFVPERDIAEGRLTSEATKSKLADKFEDKMVLGKDQAAEFFNQLEEDTKLLADHNAVDYSLFLVRITATATDPFEDPSDAQSLAAEVVPEVPPFVPPEPPSWRTGVTSADGKHIFRASVLDFFWAKHKLTPQVMTGLIKLWNIAISRQGHMTITTAPQEYRQSFLKMCHEIVEVVER